jgi:small ligand-binding sensory domain FIST
MPGSRVQAFHVAFNEDAGVVAGWPDVGEKASAVFLADPFSFPLEPFFASLRSRERFPSLVGGIASGANRAGGNLLFCDTKIYAQGGVGFVLKGAARIEPLVSHGCRPVGNSFRVTSCQRNQLIELGGRPAYESLREVLEGLSDVDRQRFMNGPQVGIQAVRNRTGEKGPSYLVRGVVGVDAESGTISLADVVRDGAVLQFHARDAETAHEDFDSLCAMANSYYPDAAGALMFLCTGRGLSLFQRSDHDIEILQKYFPDLPTSGFFAAGEIGPICGLPYVHGLTACVGLLVPQDDS